jgi:hypothetical protein
MSGNGDCTRGKDADKPSTLMPSRQRWYAGPMRVVQITANNLAHSDSARSTVGEHSSTAGRGSMKTGPSRCLSDLARFRTRSRSQDRTSDIVVKQQHPCEEEAVWDSRAEFLSVNLKCALSGV